MPGYVRLDFDIRVSIAVNWNVLTRLRIYHEQHILVFGLKRLVMLLYEVFLVVLGYRSHSCWHWNADKGQDVPIVAWEQLEMVWTLHMHEQPC